MQLRNKYSIIIVAPILIALVLACGSGQRQTAIATPENKPQLLLADVEMTGKGLKITNTDAQDFPSIEAKLNLNQWGKDDGSASAGSLGKGKSVTIPYRDFTVGTKRFNVADTVILTVYVKSGSGSSRLFLCPGKKCQPADGQVINQQSSSFDSGQAKPEASNEIFDIVDFPPGIG